MFGLVSTKKKGSHNDKIENDLVNVFVPTTPNPTSGFLLMVPKKNLIFLDIALNKYLNLLFQLVHLILINHFWSI